ncbi:hypothetical protein [Methanoculleus chikugoensis]|uniref:hypothetical protein n=1 Tax=Methanoculleus chikugoensis TaxID=118126 RepID=UPI0009423F7C|nr:hypothetical protein [Methanoculleus chikugoensis]MDD4566797.1 hypothetical protein [Methanoculleus chikugoensis]NMA09724.1 hypothetical protein [Methanomicrobiales archaeon]
MKPEKAAPRGGGEPGGLLAVIARFETGDGCPALSGPEFLRIVPPSGETYPASNHAARNPGGDPV